MDVITVEFNLTKVEVNYSIEPPEQETGDNGRINIHKVEMIHFINNKKILIDVLDLLEMREDIIYEEIREKYSTRTMEMA